MASIKVKFRPSTVADREGTVYYQIIHERKVRQLVSRYKVFPSEWDASSATVRVVPDGGRHSILLSVRAGVRMDIERLIRIDRRLDADGRSYTAADIVDEFTSFVHDYNLFNFMGNLIENLRQNSRTRTAEAYSSTLNSFKAFNAGEDVMLDAITSRLIEDYQAWLRRRGVTSNTISFYMRNLRAVYNRAMAEAEIARGSNPFRRVYTGIDKTVKRALPVEVIKRLRMLDLSRTPALDFARDMFMLSFYLRGMSFIDMAYLRKADLECGIVTYRRCKTGQQLVIGWTKEMQAILDKYADNGSMYLLPIIRAKDCDPSRAYRRAAYNINYNLKKLARMINVGFRLTMYVARHSWASVARSNGIPVSVISEGMGHDSESTTRIYLASLDSSVIDRANSLIISSLD
ncbi:MAG TPA: integrase [Porphyromonadaceae bacterium]|nr:site-specific integrase [Paramuribaculum sp.]HAB40727.1 integrase [Porphyromonadaceae bacterium]